MSDLQMLSLAELDAEYSTMLATLGDAETSWMGRQQFLQRRGYMLDPRFRPGWVPSWIADKSVDMDWAEDAVALPLRQRQIDATRIADGRQVYIKVMPTDSEALRIVQMFSRPEHRKEVENHAVPILDVFEDEIIPNQSFVVMPLLRKFNDPPFKFVREVVEFVDQMLEGLVYMHDKGVAHRDCADRNILMDPSDLFPKGFHPVLTYLDPDGKRNVQARSRLAIRKPIKYYFIDFGISVQIPAGQPRTVLGNACLDKTVPELSLTVPYDPFKEDIYILGNLFNETIFAHFANAGFLRHLVRAMTARNPDARPDASAALQQWRQIRDGMSFCRRAARLRRPSKNRSKVILLNIVSCLELCALPFYGLFCGRC